MKSHAAAVAKLTGKAPAKGKHVRPLAVRIKLVRPLSGSIGETRFMEIPIHTVSEANRRGHWAKHAKRTHLQRYLACGCFDEMLQPFVSLPCTVRLIRIAPRLLDDDNLRGALKAVRDGIADSLEVNDNDPRVRWEYAQQKGAPKTYGVRVEVLP